MNICKNKTGRILVILLASVVLILVLVGAGVPDEAISAKVCYRKNADSILYLRSYYDSGSLKATGSGFIASEDGVVFTAAHVVKGGARYTAILKDGRELDLKLIKSDEKTDIAVLRLPAPDGEEKYKAVTFADEVPEAGAILRAMGYPMKGTDIITEGLVAAKYGEVSGKGRMLVTCDIVNGMSGGPIFDEYGRVVSVVSGTVLTMNGIHLSVLSDVVYQTAEEILGKSVGTAETAAETAEEITAEVLK